MNTREATQKMLDSRRDEIATFVPAPIEQQQAEFVEKTGRVPGAGARNYPRRQKAEFREDPRCEMLRSARKRASVLDVPCTISLRDIEVPILCPILGIEVDFGNKAGGAPVVTQIAQGFGYVPGNVAVISAKANRIKNGRSAEEHELVAAWIRANDVSYLLEVLS